MPQSAHTLLLAALTLESSALARALTLAKHPFLPHAFHSGSALLLTIGLRASHLAPLLPKLPEFSQQHILLVGLAGALAPHLRVADLLSDGPLALPHASAGVITQSHEIAATPQQKQALHHSTGAHAVDMESALVRAAFAPRPVTVLRAISDDAHTHLDPATLALVDSLGRPRPAKIALTLARRPGLIPQLKQLQKNSALALDALCKSVAAFLENPPPHKEPA